MTKQACKWMVRALLIVIGPGLLGFSIAGMFYSGLGSDPTSVLVDGLHMRTSIAQGSASNIVNVALLVLLVLLNRKKVGVATLTSAFAVGPGITLGQQLIFNHLPAPGLPVALLVSVLAVLLNSFGLGLYLCADLGASAFDGLILLIKDKTGLSYKNALRVFYAVVLVIGMLLGGVWGVGTVLSLLLGGPAFQFFYRVCADWAAKWLLVKS